MTERKWRWVTRIGSYVDVWFDEQEPELMEFGVRNGWANGGDGSLFFVDDFTSMTGLTVPTDRPIRVVFTARVLEDDE